MWYIPQKDAEKKMLPLGTNNVNHMFGLHLGIRKPGHVWSMCKKFDHAHFVTTPINFCYNFLAWSTQLSEYHVHTIGCGTWWIHIFVSKAGSSTSTRFSLELQMESCGSSKLKVCEIQGHKYYFVSTGTQQEHGHKLRDCPSHSGSLGNYVSSVWLGCLQQRQTVYIVTSPAPISTYLESTAQTELKKVSIMLTVYLTTWYINLFYCLLPAAHVIALVIMILCFKNCNF